jgi:hypothetical protein
VNRVLLWLLVGLAITIASIAVFIQAGMVFPGDWGRSYSIASIGLVALALLARLLNSPTE